ncbi:MAG: type IV pilus twitching motility protein PilT [Caldicoprobacterales bacterium]|nr:type IV pilus twitching motility protein PilT [Clostridiales bacterium]
MSINELLTVAVQKNASDIHITVGVPPVLRINGQLRFYDKAKKLTPEDTKNYVYQILNEDQLLKLEKHGELDLSYKLPGVSRFRVNAYKQRSSYALAIRVVSINPPTLDMLGFPNSLKEMVMKPRGLILVTGPTGSGKSTTLAAMIDHINRNRSCHIITLEDPIEYLHRHNKSIINQREIGSDTQSFAKGLRAALREDPDVILVGEMRDIETISIAITAAETGHLVLSTLHTMSADQTIDRIIDSFPSEQQAQIKIQLAGVIEGIIAQQLLPLKNNQGRVAALEILIANKAIRNLIREGRSHQIQTSIQTGLKSGMQSMDYALANLVRQNLITEETAMQRSMDVEILKQHMRIL